MDLGDRFSRVCVLDSGGAVVEESRVQTTRDGLREAFARRPAALVVIEVGGHSPWVDRELRAMGHEVIVANARALPTIYASDRKNDRNDARRLAELARVDRKLLSPIQHRSEQAQVDLAVVRARDVLVRTRTQLMNSMRGVVKATGGRLGRCSSAAFVKKCEEQVPPALRAALTPMLRALDAVGEQIREYDRRIVVLASERYPATQVVGQPSGVGPVTSLAYVLTLDDPRRFAKSRQVAAWLGLVPRQDQSGAQDRQLPITKAGDRFLRRLLVTSANYILGPFGPDTALRRFGLKLCERGGSRAKKRATVAVARKLAALMHRLWVTGEIYEPLRGVPTAATA